MPSQVNSFMQALHYKARGFTYVGLLILLAIIALASSVTIQGVALLQQRAAEEQLLLVGEEFQSALQRYAQATPVGQRTQPAALKDLLNDPRYPTARRYLRQIYVDPLTGTRDWGVLRGKEGIVAVYSLSPRQPLKISNFPLRHAEFAGATSYSKWIFTSLPRLNRRQDQLFVPDVERASE